MDYDIIGKMKVKGLVMLMAGAIIVAGCVFALLMRGEPKPTGENEDRKISAVSGKGGSKRLPAGSARKGSGRKHVNTPLSRADAKRQLYKGLEFDAAEEARLSAEQKKLLEEIRRVLDKEDRAGLIKLVQKMQESDEWPDGIPIAIRKTAIEALAWFGHDCIPEMLGFFQDPDTEIQQASIDAYEQAIFDANGDEEISLLVVVAAKAINDYDAMDSILMSLNDMRPSRQVETIKEIWAHGTEAAKKAMNENIEFILGEEGIDTPEKLDEWYNDPSGDHKDDEDAEEFYGPQKD